MLERRYSYKQIMKECHVSPSTISSIKKKVIGSEYNETSKVATKISKETQALKLFNEGKTLFQVATELDIAADSVFVIYQNFQRLRNMEAFISSYEQVKGNIQPFLHLFDLMNGLGMTPEQVAQQADYGTRLPYLGNIRLQLSNQVQALESQLNFARSQLEQSKASLGFYNNECEKKRNELLAIHSELNTRKILIQDFDNDEGYNRIKEAAKKETKLLMQNNQVSCAVTLTATLEAIRRYPDNQILISDIVTSRNYSTTSYQQPWMELHAPKLLQLMQNVQNEIAEQITGMVVNSMKSIRHGSHI